MNKFNLSQGMKEEFNSWKTRFVMHFLCEKGRKLEDFGITPRKVGEPDIMLNVEIKINGVAVDLNSFVEMMSESYGEMVNRSARRMLDDNLDLNEIQNKLSELRRHLEYKIEDLFPDFTNKDY